MLKVLFVAENLGYGGAQKMLTFVANNLDRSKYQVAVLNENSGAKVARPLSEDIEYYEHPKFTKRGIRRLKELSMLIKTARKANPDVIVSFLGMPNFLATVAGLLLRVPVIISERGDPSQCMGKSERFFRRFEGMAAGAVFQTEGAKSFYPKCIQKKAVIIPNPVVPATLSQSYTYNQRLKNIAFVGRFEKVQKRQDIALKAIAVLLKKNVDVTLNFYGSGPDEELVRKIAEQEGISDNVIFHGKTENPQEELLKNDIFLITSDYEGIPNALIEAMSIGMPCVSTDCSPGGAAFLIQNEENGLLVNARDVDAIANALERFINDPGLARACGEKAKLVNELYAPDVIIDMWNQYISRVLERK